MADHTSHGGSASKGLVRDLGLRVAAVAALVNEWLTDLNSLAAQHDRLRGEARQIIREMQWLGEIVRGAGLEDRTVTAGSVSD